MVNSEQCCVNKKHRYQNQQQLPSFNLEFKAPTLFHASIISFYACTIQKPLLEYNPSLVNFPKDLFGSNHFARWVGRRARILRRKLDTCVSIDSVVPKKNAKSQKLLLPNGKSLSKSNFEPKSPNIGGFLFSGKLHYFNFASTILLSKSINFSPPCDSLHEIVSPLTVTDEPLLLLQSIN